MGAPLEVTITHNLGKAVENEVDFLLKEGLIAIDWGRLGTADPAAYSGNARKQVELFHRMRNDGAAVIAAYADALRFFPSARVAGWVEPGTSFEFPNGLICLRLQKRKLVDSASSFIGNLTPRSCAVQSCHSRAKGRLLALVRGDAQSRSVWLLHHRDVESLVANYLISVTGCRALWSGGRSFATVDHVAWAADGRELLSQTTVSHAHVRKKSQDLAKLGSPQRRLMLFGPAASAQTCAAGVEFVAIEDVFRTLDGSPSGRWLIDCMLQDSAHAAAR